MDNNEKEVLKNQLIEAIIEEGSLYAACQAVCMDFSLAIDLQKEDANFAKAIQMANTATIDTVVSNLYKIAISPDGKGLDGHGGGVLKASELFLRRNGALTDVSVIRAQPEGLAEISKAVKEYEEAHPEKVQEG